MDITSEVRLAFRALRRRPGVVLLAVLALGVGIGLPAAIFSVVDATFRRGLPVEDGRRILHLERRPAGARGEGWGVEARDFLAWREAQRSFERLGAFQTRTVTVRDGLGADRWPAARMSANAFEILRVPAARGRAFQAGDDEPGAEPVVVLGHALWRDRFAADPGVLGRVLFIDDAAHTIVGVMPEGLRFPTGEDLWIPLVLPADAAEGSGPGTFDVFGRLRDGASRRDALAEFAVIAARLAEQYPETNRNMGVAVKPFTERYMGETATSQAYVMLAAVLLVLLVASVNVANLQLVRAVERLRDLAVRAALGASRLRIVRQLLLESGAMALLGGLVGVIVAALAIRGLGRLFPPYRMPFWFELRLDLSVLLFIGTLSVTAALLAGVLPALRTAGQNLLATLSEESRGSTGLRVGRLMQGLVTLEIAFSLGLLVTAGLMLIGVGKVQPDRLGMSVADVVTARASLPEATPAAERRQYWATLAAALAAEAAVADVVLADALPAEHAPAGRFAIEGREYPPDARLPSARWIAASDGLFRMFGREVVSGRTFNGADGPDGLPVALVNERFARVHFRGGNAIGQRIRAGESGDEPWRTIVGVVPDLWTGGLDSAPDRNPPGVYVPIAQAPPVAAAVAVRARADAGAAAAAIRAATFRLRPDVPVHDEKSMAGRIRDNSWFYGMAASMLTVAGLAALVLATAGLYGVIAFGVGRRRREIGIRMAFGAHRRDIVLLVLRRGAPGILAGLGLGLGLAFLIARGVSSLLFGVRPDDVRVFGAVGLFLAAVAVAAAVIPAGRAAATDPLEALRSE
jgi:predicted permease